ncbi:hypothetical protein LX36DRAFT_664771 [Colletotrichum falcatum]|nr:hypothetical protein LX36DRAFT_664771 [Colletotrichum falcatum]
MPAASSATWIAASAGLRSHSSYSDCVGKMCVTFPSTSPKLHVRLVTYTFASRVSFAGMTNAQLRYKLEVVLLTRVERTGRLPSCVLFNSGAMTGDRDGL